LPNTIFFISRTELKFLHYCLFSAAGGSSGASGSGNGQAEGRAKDGPAGVCRATLSNALQMEFHSVCFI